MKANHLKAYLTNRVSERDMAEIELDARIEYESLKVSQQSDYKEQC